MKHGTDVGVYGRILMSACCVIGLAVPAVAEVGPPVSAGLTAWYQGDNVSCYGGDVIAWNDSATGDGAQSWGSDGSLGGGRCPSWINDGTGPNGQPYVFLDKAGMDGLVYEDIRDMGIRTNVTMTFVIWPQKYSETPTEPGTVFYDSGAAKGTEISLTISADNTVWKAWVSDNSSPPVEIEVSCPRVEYKDNWSVLTLRWDSSENTLSLYQNGALGDSETNPSFDSATEWGGPTEFGQARIGSFSYDGGHNAHMGLLEILMYDRALTGEEVAETHAYIKNKYWPASEAKRPLPEEHMRGRSAEAPADGLSNPTLLASGGQTGHHIVLGADAVESENTAAEELARYLKASTGAVFPTVSESDMPVDKPGIYLGWTEFSRRHDVEPERLGIDEFVIQNAGNDLILCGSRLRGTIYAVGEFLERFCGIRWLTFHGEEYVPQRSTLAVPSVSIRQKPAFIVRDMMPRGTGDRAFSFLRINGHSTALHRTYAGLTKKWGEMQEPWKGGHLVHTLHSYLPPEKYFESHPEYFGLVDGERVKDAQICFTNGEARKLILKHLVERIESEGAGIYNISCPEHVRQCRCKHCRAVMEREGTLAALVIDLVNYLAESIRGKYQDVTLETLAYNYTIVPPENMKVADDVILRIGHLNRHFFEPMTSVYNRGGEECWRGWSKVAKNLALWGYTAYCFPSPNMARVYSEDLQFYKRLGVKRAFYQYGPTYTHGMADLREWLLAKLMWDPEQDTEALVDDFCSHYYGPAGPFVVRYIDILNNAYAESNSQAVHFNVPDGVDWFRNEYRAGRYPTCLPMWMIPPRFTTYRYLDLAFFNAAHEAFRRAEDHVKDAPVLLARARRARLTLDRTSLSLFNRLAEEYGVAAGTLDGFPMDRGVIARRYLDTMSRDRFGRFIKEDKRTVKFLETARKADRDQCDWVRGYYPEVFE